MSTVPRALAATLALTLFAASGSAVAWAPNPVRPATADIYAGRWHEIARLPNAMQKDCQGPTSDFQSWDGTNFNVIESCHRGAPTGPLKTVRARARLVTPGDYTRFRMSFFGGLVHQEYWVLDHADDDSWLITATPGGNFIWLMARRPVLPAPQLAAALRRMAALGYPTARLVYPAQAPG